MFIESFRYCYRVKIEVQTKAPLVKGGCLGLPRRGDSVAKATDLFTIPSSLFTKKLSLFHIGWYFEEVPTVNPLYNKRGEKSE